MYEFTLGPFDLARPVGHELGSPRKGFTLTAFATPHNPGRGEEKTHSSEPLARISVNRRA
jgi:hypothetical protein